MAHITKTVTYAIPDKRFGGGTSPNYTGLWSDSEGKTSTMEYTGPQKLILWMDRETNAVVESWDPEDMTERAIPLEWYQMEIESDSNDNIVRMILLWGGVPAVKLYEVDVGPADQWNNVIVDPTDIREVYHDCSKDYDGEKWGPLVYVNHAARNTWDVIRAKRNQLLNYTDGRTTSGVPLEDRTIWENYQQLLRDVPEDWKDVPEELVRMPQAPDNNDGNLGEVTGTEGYPFNDPEKPVIMIVDRTAEDDEVINQFPEGVK